MSKIFVVEDDDNLRELISYALTSSGFLVEGFSTSDGLLERIPNESPRLVLLDIMLPGENGLEILRKLRESKDTQNLPVILLTAKGSEYDKVIGLDTGADDYITKPFSVLEMISRVKALLRRTEDQTSNLLSFEEIQIDSDRRKVLAAGKEVPLTFKEFELLSYFVLNKGIVLTRDRIIEQVWGYDHERESRTVDMHVKSLRHKLGSLGDRIQTVRGVGYKIEE